MKRESVRSLGVMVLALVASFATMTTALPQDKAKDKEKTHDEIRAMRDAILAAIKAKDVDALLKHLHPDVVLTAQDGKELKVIRKHDGVKEYITRHLSGPNAGLKSLTPDVTVDELTILHGEDTGIAFGSSKDHYVLADGNQYDLSTRWSATMIKHEGKWKVASLQVGSGWFDSPVVQATTKMMYWVGGIAAVVGIVIGLVVMRLVRK